MFNSPWLSCYPRSRDVIFDNNNKFEKDCSIKHTPITTQNPEANIILEWVHQDLGDMLRTKTLQDREVDDIYLLRELLSAIAWTS